MEYDALLLELRVKPAMQYPFSLVAYTQSHQIPLACGHGDDLALLLDRATQIARALGFETP